MSFTPLMIKVVTSLLDTLPGGASVVELGNQTFDPTISGTLSKPQDLMLPLVIRHLERRGKPCDIAALRALAALNPEQQKPATGAFFKALGFSSYDAIDVNSLYGSLVMDLNTDLREHYGFTRTFDLVTNNGTGEHIFNQYAVFKNMHQLTKVGGLLLFVLPFHNWFNHGFFNFNPILFGDLATANDYKILRLSVGVPEGAETGAAPAGASPDEISFDWQPRMSGIELRELQQRGSVKPLTTRTTLWWLSQRMALKNPMQQKSRLPQMVGALAERSSNVNVVAVLQKTTDAAFAAPLQGMYSGANVETTELRSAYKIA